MTMPKIKSVRGLEILDSRGRPTVKAYVELDNNITSAASVPSGASTGKSEAHELRDGEKRFGGFGCRQAVANINQIINQNLTGKSFDSQGKLDQLLIQLDGSGNKSRLGANALLSVSLAYARALASSRKQPLFNHFSKISNNQLDWLPRPAINLFSGGKHAGGQVPIQDLLMVPVQDSMHGILECAYAIYQSAARLCMEKYQMRALTADEGGLAPPFNDVYGMFDHAIEAIEKAGYSPGTEVHLAIDVASSHFYKDKRYYLGTSVLTTDDMVKMLTKWASNYPIISIEDGLAEDDWEGWVKLQESIGSRCLVLGDDLLCTNPERIERAAAMKSANALLLKVNQIGTITEALMALQLARKAIWQITISARSGETEDDWLSDLAVGWQAEFIKIGSITQSDRLAKYNRLLEIEQETKLPVSELRIKN